MFIYAVPLVRGVGSSSGMQQSEQDSFVLSVRQPVLMRAVFLNCSPGREAMYNWPVSASGMPVGISVMGLTVDQWCVLAAIVGILGSVVSTLLKIHYQKKADKREEARLYGSKT